jgi:hypothetical protein
MAGLNISNAVCFCSSPFDDSSPRTADGVSADLAPYLADAGCNTEVAVRSVNVSTNRIVGQHTKGQASSSLELQMEIQGSEWDDSVVEWSIVPQLEGQGGWMNVGKTSGIVTIRTLIASRIQSTLTDRNGVTVPIPLFFNFTVLADGSLMQAASSHRWP